jgi:hypothetical protein
MKTTKPSLKELTESGYRYVNSDITGKNFPIPDVIETEGYRLITMEKSFSSQEALDRIKSEGLRPANIYELALLKQYHHELWPKGTWTSLLAFGSIWTDAVGHSRVPYVYAYSDGDFWFSLGGFEGDWDAGSCLLCFCDNQTSDTLPPAKELETFGTSALTDEQAIAHLKNNGYRITKEVVTTTEY